MTNTLINKLGIGALTLALAGSLNGCRDNSNDFCKKGKYNGYNVLAVFDGNGRRVTIYSDVDEDFSGRAGIFASERRSYLKDKKRFSQIQINKKATEGHPLEAYANLDSLEKIYNYVKENGEDCK